MTPTEKGLRAAKARLRKRGAWCQYMLAMFSSGIGTHPRHPAAVKWCALGALHREGAPKRSQYLLNLAASELYVGQPWTYTTVSMVNDKLGLRAVLRCYDRAIEMAAQ